MMKNFSRNKESAGFTLIETIVVTAITSLVLVTFGALIVYFYRTNAYALEQSIAVGQARSGVENAMLHLREATYGSDGSYPINSAATSSITFYANTNADSAIERVTYRLIGQTLYRMIASPVGNPLTYVGATVSTSTISIPVVNGASTPIFRYFNNAGAELTIPIDISKISSIKTTLIIDVNVDRAPVSFTLTGSATLRNLKK